MGACTSPTPGFDSDKTGGSDSMPELGTAPIEKPFILHSTPLLYCHCITDPCNPEVSLRAQSTPVEKHPKSQAFCSLSPLFLASQRAKCPHVHNGYVQHRKQ